MFKRRSIGPAFERSPLERLIEWAYQNVLFLISTAVAIAVWLVLVNWAFDKLFPTVTGEGTGAQEIRESSNGPVAVALKLLGALVIVLVFHKQSNKR